MCNKTLIRNDYDNTVILIDSDAIFPVCYINSEFDECCLCDSSLAQVTKGDLEYVCDYYSEQELSGFRVLVPVDSQWSNFATGSREVVNVLKDSWGTEETEEYLDVTDLICFNAKAVDIEHGIKVERITFDEEEGNDMSYYTLCELHGVKTEILQGQDYPHKQCVVEYTGYDGMGKKVVVREYIPFFRDDSIPEYELIEK